MNKLPVHFLIAATLLVPLGQNTSLSAQSLASVNVGATIVTPMTIAKENDLEFQNASIGFKSSAAQPEHGMRNAPKNNKMEVPDTEKVIKGTFVISGAAGYMYNLTMPETVNLNVDNRQLNIDISACSASGNHTLSQNGGAVISIEGVLSAGNSGGLAYHSGKFYDFPVTINNE